MPRDQRLKESLIKSTLKILLFGASLVAQKVKTLPAMKETWVWSLGEEDPLEKEMATHSSILAWRILLTKEPSRLQFMKSQRVGHSVYSLSWSKMELNPYFSYYLGLPCWVSDKESACQYRSPGSGRSPEEGTGNPLQYSCLGNPMDRGAWWATVHGVTKSGTWLSD